MARRWIAIAIIGAAAGVALLALALVIVPRLGAAEVRVIQPTPGRVLRTVVVSGRVRAPAKIRIGSLVAGVAAEVPVREGDRVRKGDLVLRLDDRELQASVRAAQASLAQARAHLAQVHRVSRPVADAALAQARVRRRQAAEEVARMEQLVRAGSASRQDLDMAWLELDLAKAQERSARVQLAESAGGGVGILAARAAVDQASAALGEAEARLEQTRIRAPADGVALLRSVEPGDAVQPGSVLLVMARKGPTELVAYPDERNLGALAVGQKAVASADAWPDRGFDATVTFLAPSIDPDRGTVEMRLEVPEAPDFLRPDMTVSVEVVVARRDGVLTLPDDAVHDVAGPAPWALVVKDGRAAKVPLELGLRGETGVEILGGVTADERVIPLTAGDVRPGRRVAVEDVR